MFLSSDTDSDSEWDSDSSDLPNGPLKQALDVDLADKNKYDFVTNPPETGDQFLVAVRRERKQTPKYTVADMDKIREHKNRKLAKLAKTVAAAEENNEATSTTTNVSTSSEVKSEQPSTSSSSGVVKASADSTTTDTTTESSEDCLTSEVERLTLEEQPTTSKVVTIKDEAEVAADDEIIRFLPTDLWRHDRVSQFMYMRDKIDNLRVMMQDGHFILLNRFGKTHSKDRVHWLRYCFGTEEASRMIETKRSLKLAAKSLYDTAKKETLEAYLAKQTSDDNRERLESLTSGDEEDEVSDEISDVEFVSTEEVKRLEMLDKMRVEAESAARLESSEVDPLSETTQIPLLEATLEEDRPPSQEAEAVKKDEPLPAEAAKDETSQEITGDDEQGCTAEDDPVLEMIPEDEATIKEAHCNKYGRDPTVHHLLSMPNKLVEYLLTLHLEWVKEFGFMSRRQGSWLYSLMTFIPEPVDPSIVSDLRGAVPSLVMRRDKAIQQIEASLAASSTNKDDQGKDNDDDAAAAAEYDEKGQEDQKEAENTSPVETKHIEPQELPEKIEDFDAQDVLATCNLFIALIVDFFGQKDLNKFLAGSDDSQY